MTQTSKYKIYRGNCIELMKKIPDKSIDMILCDLPYGVTKAIWDKIIPFDNSWENYNRVIKSNGVICLFGSEPFSTFLRMSNMKNFRYDWIWKKNRGTGFFYAKSRPMKSHEIISVFYENRPTYNPQMRKGYKPYKCKQGKQSGIFGGGK